MSNSQSKKPTKVSTKVTADKAASKTPPENFNAGKPTAETCSEVLGAWNGELLRFHGQRLSQNWLFPQKAMTCVTPSEFVELQSEFYSALMDDYREEAKRLTSVLNFAHETANSERSSYNAGLLKAQDDAAAIIEQARQQAEKIMASALQAAKIDMSESTEGDKPATSSKVA